MISQRDAFWGKVYENARKDRDIVVVSADMGAPALDRFRRDLPSQFVNVGIAEQNAITLAAGLAMNGKKVFTYAIAPFITLRCLELIRVENAIMNIPIVIVGVGGGYGYEDSGPTHHLIEDLAIMRSMPNIRIHSITDAVMASKIADLSCRPKDYTNYVRLERMSYPSIYSASLDISKGFSVLKEGEDSYIISTGSMSHVALKAAEMLKAKGIKVGVIDLFTLPIETEEFMRIVSRAKKLITLEEHFMAGGLGSAVCEVLCDAELLIPVKRLGVAMDKGYNYKYGGRDIIRGYLGIDEESTARRVEEFLSK